jgi:hypothetical protein
MRFQLADLGLFTARTGRLILSGGRLILLHIKLRKNKEVVF